MQAKRSNRTMVNMAVDLSIFVAFLVATAPRLSGLAIHEWLGLALGAALLTHLLLHWSWLVGVTRRFFGKVAWSARLNYVLNTLLFIAFTIIIVTGVLISEVAMPLLGISFANDRLWENLHRVASDATVLLVGLHVAVHWRWIVNVVRRIFTRRPGLRAAPQLDLAGSPTVSPLKKEAH